MKQFDVAIIGGGHAGCEAALAVARMGLSALLVTLRKDRIAEMSCNPSIGGVGKGQLVKELDALGGEMGKAADFTGIQFKRLNTRKGSAVQSSRCQSDKKQYALRMQATIAAQAGLEVHEGEVKRLVVEEGRLVGLELDGETVGIGAAVITAGTFLRGLLHCGSKVEPGGRHGELPATGLSEQMLALGFRILRLKTGTPPRLLRDSIDFSRMERQDGDVPPYLFSFSPTRPLLPQVPCFLTYSNAETHAAIRAHLGSSPLFSGQIKGVGPRYCPSIEDKVVKFPQKDRHALFFEPEALDSDWIYPNGISTSLPAEAQEAFVRTLPGCADVKFARFGYAVEYDCFDPRDLHPTFESKHVRGLYLAGQVNGTSGYEEAAIQGLHAGINAALAVKKETPVVVPREKAYLGVLVDDLTRVGVNEPYRMFTSRAEYRLTLREDNADSRLRAIGRRLGLVSDEDWRRFEEKEARIQQTRVYLQRTRVPGGQTLEQTLRRPEVALADLNVPAIPPDVHERVEIEVKYEGYIAIQTQEIARLERLSGTAIPETLDFGRVDGLTAEVRETLGRHRPRTLSDAARISGMTPSALSSLLFHLRQREVPL